MSGRTQVGIRALLTGYDFELPLYDALDDPDLDPTRQTLVVLAMGAGLDDGYLAAAELVEAAAQLAADRDAGVSDSAGEGAAKLRAILRAPCDDYQRALWHAVSRCPPRLAAEHLAWLAELMRARGSMWRAIKAAGAPMPLLPGADHAGSARLDHG